MDLSVGRMNHLKFENILPHILFENHDQTSNKILLKYRF